MKQHEAGFRHPHQAIPRESLQNIYTNRPHLNAEFMRNRIASFKQAQSVRIGPAILDAEAYAVRVYCYCPETGVYQGEDFMDECRLDSIEGATRIAPPVHGHGEVPVFDTSAHCWNIIKLPKKRRSPPMDQS